MKLTDEQAKEIEKSASYSGRTALNVTAAWGRAAFEASMRIALANPDAKEVEEAYEYFSKQIPQTLGGFRVAVGMFCASRVASYYEPQDRTTDRLQKWFETHGHPEFAHDPQPLEQLAAIVIDEYEKRKKSEQAELRFHHKGYEPLAGTRP